jgi:hypothetical protein
MNHKKLLIATLATAFSGMISASDVTILPYPYPVKEIDYTKLALQACEDFGDSKACSDLKALFVEAQETIDQTGAFNWTPEQEARKEACIQAILGQIEQRKEVFADKIDATMLYIQDVAEDAKEAGHDLAQKLGITDNKQE